MYLSLIASNAPRITLWLSKDVPGNARKRYPTMPRKDAVLAQNLEPVTRPFFNERLQDVRDEILPEQGHIGIANAYTNVWVARAT